MDFALLSYRELAARQGWKVDTARKTAHRQGWDKSTSPDGTHVLVKVPTSFWRPEGRDDPAYKGGRSVVRGRLQSRSFQGRRIGDDALLKGIEGHLETMGFTGGLAYKSFDLQRPGLLLMHMKPALIASMFADAVSGRTG